MMAKFKFRHAVMTAGKSRDLARVHFNYHIKGENVLVIVPSTDNRNGIGLVSARSGERLKATAVNPGELTDFLIKYFQNIDNENKNVACVLIDETQFFSKKDIFSLKEIVVIERNIPVIAYGLKNDFKNDLFEGSAAAILVAEKLEEIETLCAFCNKKATMNLRFHNGVPIKKGEQVQIGDDEYRPVCHKHWLDENLRIWSKTLIDINIFIVIRGGNINVE